MSCFTFISRVKGWTFWRRWRDEKKTWAQHAREGMTSLFTFAWCHSPAGALMWYYSPGAKERWRKGTAEDERERKVKLVHGRSGFLAFSCAFLVALNDVFESRAQISWDAAVHHGIQRHADTRRVMDAHDPQLCSGEAHGRILPVCVCVCIWSSKSLIYSY